MSVSNHRGRVISYYNYELINNNNNNIEFFKTRDEIKDKYGMSYSSIRTIIKKLNRSIHTNSKYTNFDIKKIKKKINDNDINGFK